MEALVLGRAVHGHSGAGEGLAGRWTPARIVLIALQGLFVGATLILFGAWLAASTSHRPTLWGFIPGSDCESFGRGGVRCSASSANEPGRNASFGAGEDCVSMGRGGLFCKTPPGNREPAG